jgi:hypothetical protein
MRRFKPLLLCWLGLLIAGCTPPNLDTLDYPETMPSIADVAGFYLPTPETQKDIVDRGGYPKRDASILFAADGTLTLLNIPDWWLDAFGKPGGKFINEKGTWKIEKQQDFYVVNINFPGDSNTIFLNGHNPPYFLNLDLGDPDSGKAMIFARQK